MKASIGSISTGTMKASDLIPCFASVLAQLDEENEYLALVVQCNELEDYDLRNDGSDGLEDILNDLFEALNEQSPPYCHFSAHDGDGSDYGFWLDWDSINEAIHDGYILKVDDLASVPADHHGGSVLVVSDHGNATLYQAQIEWREVWAVV